MIWGGRRGTTPEALKIWRLGEIFNPIVVGPLGLHGHEKQRLSALNVSAEIPWLHRRTGQVRGDPREKMTALERIKEIEKLRDIKDPIDLRCPVTFDTALFLLKAFRAMREIGLTHYGPFANPGFMSGKAMQEFEKKMRSRESDFDKEFEKRMAKE